MSRGGFAILFSNNFLPVHLQLAFVCSGNICASGAAATNEMELVRPTHTCIVHIYTQRRRSEKIARSLQFHIAAFNMDGILSRKLSEVMNCDFLTIISRLRNMEMKCKVHYRTSELTRKQPITISLNCYFCSIVTLVIKKGIFYCCSHIFQVKVSNLERYEFSLSLDLFDCGQVQIQQFTVLQDYLKSKPTMPVEFT
jgi:hypothetical protein